MARLEVGCGMYLLSLYLFYRCMPRRLRAYHVSYLIIPDTSEAFSLQSQQAAARMFSFLGS